MGLTYPGCAETYESETSQDLSRRRSSQMGQLQGGGDQQRSRRADQHQKVHRIRRGDIVAIPAGVAHWCYNDGNEELVAFTVMDLSNHANQLDRRFRVTHYSISPSHLSHHVYMYLRNHVCLLCLLEFLVHISCSFLLTDVMTKTWFYNSSIRCIIKFHLFIIGTWILFTMMKHTLE